MTLPKPDYIWSISRSIHGYRKSNLLSDDGKEALEGVSTLHSPYLLLEAKSNGGSDAVVGAIRIVGAPSLIQFWVY